MSYTAAGVLPYAYYNNTVYFLLGKEHKEIGWSGSEKYADFGGSVETKHKDFNALSTITGVPVDKNSTFELSKIASIAADYPKYTAAVEFWEETMGLFYDTKEMFDLLKNQNNIVTTPPYAEHLVNIEYNPFWVDIFKSAYDYVLSCAKPHDSKEGYMYIPSCPEGFTEKTEIKWFSYDEIKKAIEQKDPTWSNLFRPEFISTVSKIFTLPAFKTIIDKSTIFIDSKLAAPITKIINEPSLLTILPSKAPAIAWNELSQKLSSSLPIKGDIITTANITSIDAIDLNKLPSYIIPTLYELSLGCPKNQLKMPISQQCVGVTSSMGKQLLAQMEKLLNPNILKNTNVVPVNIDSKSMAKIPHKLIPYIVALEMKSSKMANHYQNPLTGVYMPIDTPSSKVLFNLWDKLLELNQLHDVKIDDEKKIITTPKIKSSLITDNKLMLTDKIKELINFLKSKNPTYTDLALWKGSYCPLQDTKLSASGLGEGAYGQVYLLEGPKYMCCPKQIMKFVVKSVKSVDTIDKTQLNKIDMNPLIKLENIIAPGKITDIFATEVGSMVYTNYLINNSICRNFPYFFGAQECNSNHTIYMYMQYIQNKINKPLTVHRNAIIIQGIMAIMALYQIKLIHGDINRDNMMCLKLSKPMKPLYKIADQYYLGPSSPYILYFIDFGMGYVDDKLLPAPRIAKDQTRSKVNVSWSADTFVPSKKVLSNEAYLAYKGYYIDPKTGADSAYLRRHLLDFYLFTDTIAKLIGDESLLDNSTFINPAFLDLFTNPLYYVSNPAKISENKYPFNKMEIDSKDSIPQQYINKAHKNLLVALSTIGLAKLPSTSFEIMSKDDIIYMGQW